MSSSTQKNNLFHRFDGVLWGNPVLALGLGVPFAVIATVSMRSAAVLAAAMLCTAVPVFLVASLCARYIPQWLRAVVYSLVSAAALIPLRALLFSLFPAVFDTLGVYYALMALNPAVMIPALSHRVTGEKPGFALLNALCYSLGFALVLFGIALIREPVGSGTIWGHPVEFPFQLAPAQFPFFGFILLGYFAAVYQFLERLFVLVARKRGRFLKNSKKSRREEEKIPDSGSQKEQKKKLTWFKRNQEEQAEEQTGHNDTEGITKKQLDK